MKSDVVVLAGAAFVALGLARFSYALVLPSMRADLSLSYTAAGSLGTANTAGYLVGLALLPRLTERWSMVAVFRASVAVTALALVGTGLSHDYAIVFTGRVLAGAAGAGAFILGSAIAASLQSARADAVVIFNAGAGAGVVIAGLVLPTLLARHVDRWPFAWFLLGALGVLAAVAIARRSWAAPSSAPVRVSVRTALGGRPTLHWLTASYACFGSGYIVYVTFLLSTLRSGGASVALTSTAFVTLGALTVAAPRLWRPLLASWSPRQLMTATMSAQATGAAVLVLSRSTPAIVVSVVVFGSAFLVTPALVPMTIRSVRPASEWTATIGAVTVFFALGQAVAPWMSGMLIDRFGVTAGPIWTIVFSVVGAVIAWMVRV